MTHLLMDPSRHEDKEKDGCLTRTVVRTGTPITLVYLAYFEQESTFSAMNEVFHLLNLPELDSLFRTELGTLKPYLSFIVDNGHGEDPSSQLTQMCLARILQYCRLKKVSQRSFAEYHSKRNFVKRVHSAENAVLSGHGPFSSMLVHDHVEIGSIQHYENMDARASSVVDSLRQATFNKKKLVCHRGSKEKVFDDEEKLKTFLALNEEQKEECGWTYKPCYNDLTKDLDLIWGASMEERLYFDDYALINNVGGRTAWKDKYSTTLVRDNPDFYEPQPIPNYIEWFKSGGELHYCSTEQTAILCQRIPGLKADPAIFLPEKILFNCFKVSINPPDLVMQNISLLCWLPLDMVEKKFILLREKANKEMHDSENRLLWSKHDLYRLNVDALKQRCKKRSLPTDGIKYELVKRLVDGPRPLAPPAPSLKMVSNDISSLRKMPIYHLKKILADNGLCSIGKKDDLVLRVFLLKNNRRSAVAEQERKELLKTINIAEDCMREQHKDIIASYPMRWRKHSSSVEAKSKIGVPSAVKSEKEIVMIFSDLKLFLTTSGKQEDKPIDGNRGAQMEREAPAGDEYEAFFEVGAVVKIKLTDQCLALGKGWFSACV